LHLVYSNILQRKRLPTEALNAWLGHDTESPARRSILSDSIRSRALYWAAVVNGVLAAPPMAAMMLIVRNPQVTGRLTVTGNGDLGRAAGRRDGRGFARVFHPAVERAAPRHGSERRRREPKVASSKAVEVDPARLLAQCRRTAAARLGFSGDIKGLGAP